MPDSEEIPASVYRKVAASKWFHDAIVEPCKVEFNPKTGNAYVDTFDGAKVYVKTGPGTSIYSNVTREEALAAMRAPEVTDEMFAGALASFTMSEHRGNDRALALKRGADFINQALRRAGT
jgi:hypothetical protein